METPSRSVPSHHGVAKASEYTAAAAACQALGVVQSMGRVGSALDNAAESFNSTLKVEFAHRHRFVTRAEARIRVATWIADFYNTTRRHSASDGLAPIRASDGTRTGRISDAGQDRSGITPSPRLEGIDSWPHQLLPRVDTAEVSGGEALAGLLRPGNAGSNTAADHVTVLEQALAAMPEHARSQPGDPDSVRVVARLDSAGATHAFAQACRDRGVWFSFGFPVDVRVQSIVDQVPEDCWEPAIQTDGGIRDGAWVADITGMLELAAWPDGAKVIVRAERPHPGAQLTFTDVDGHRITAFITDIPDRVIAGQAAGRELNHRQHARVEDRIREGKAAGLRNFPCRGWDENIAWLETVLAGIDLVCWAKLLGFTGTPELAHAEIATFRNLVLHVARLTRGARQVRIRIDHTWKYAQAIADAWLTIRAAFTRPEYPSPQPERHGSGRHDSRSAT